MLDFKKIELCDIQKIRMATSQKNMLACEKNALNLFVWQQIYDNMYCIKDGMLFVKSGKKESESFALPICDDFQKGMNMIFEYKGQKKPTFWVQRDEQFDEFKKLFGDEYDISPERDAFDYIYNAADLINLSGKKYHSKRNHISAFSKQFDWEYKPITNDNKVEIIECVNLWYKENIDRFDEYMAVEKQGIITVLENMELFGASGGAIYVGNKPVAFTLGAPINEKVFDIHFEKALRDYSTAYSVINNEFAKTLTNYRYINREDDMGLSGLRQAKMSYRPEILLEKFLCAPIEIACMKIYDDAFHDGSFTKELFENCFKYLKYIKENGEVVAICFALPCEIDGKKAKYIYGFTTKEGHRGRGYGKSLMNKLKDETDDILILRPANNLLFDYYGAMGFKEINASDKEGKIKVLPLDEFKKIATPEKNGEFKMMYYGKNDVIEGNLHFPFSMA